VERSSKHSGYAGTAGSGTEPTSLEVHLPIVKRKRREHAGLHLLPAPK
jgi:hypothetical protein